MICQKFLKWMIGCVLLAFFLPACALLIAPMDIVVPTATIEPPQFSDPFTYNAIPQPALDDFCQANPNADLIPQTVTGRATIYDWHCVDGTPQAAEQLFTPDPQGFLSDFWYELGSR